jgi:rubredoxin
MRPADESPGQAPEPQEYMRKWQCIVCGWIYDEAEGLEEEGIAPGTRWEDVPDDFVCPECGVSKEDFEMIEIG